MTTFNISTHQPRRNILLSAMAAFTSAAIGAPPSLTAVLKPLPAGVPAPTTLPPLPTWQAFSGSLTPGSPLDDAHLLLDVPEFARGPQLQLTATCSLSAISKLALFAAPTPAGLAVADLKSNIWVALAVYDAQLNQLPEITLTVPFTANTSYIFAVVAAGKLQSVRRSVKRVT